VLQPCLHCRTSNCAGGTARLVLAVPALPARTSWIFDRHAEVFEAAYQWCRGRIDELDKQGSPALARSWRPRIEGVYSP